MKSILNMHYGKYAAVIALVASLGASISFNPESKLIAREDYKKNVHQMALASQDSQSGTVAATPLAKRVQTDLKGDAASKANDPNNNIEIKPGETRKDTKFSDTASLEITLSPDGSLVTVKCVPVCDSCSDQTKQEHSGTTTMPAGGYRILAQLENIAITANKDVKSCSEGVVVNGHKSHKRDSDESNDGNLQEEYEVGDFSLANSTCDTSTDSSSTSVMSDETPDRSSSASDWRHFANFSKCFIKEKVKDCETFGMTQAQKENYHGHKTSAAITARCHNVVESIFEDNIKGVIKAGLMARTDVLPQSNIHATAVALMNSILGMKPSSYITPKMAQEMDDMTRESTITLAKQKFNEDLNYANAYYTRCTAQLMRTGSVTASLATTIQQNCAATKTQMIQASAADALNSLNTTSSFEGNILSARNDELTAANNDSIYSNLYNNRYLVPVTQAESLLNTTDANAILNANIPGNFSSLSTYTVLPGQPIPSATTPADIATSAAITPGTAPSAPAVTQAPAAPAAPTAATPAEPVATTPRPQGVILPGVPARGFTLAPNPSPTSGRVSGAQQ
jgi:hypothetical protein